MTSMLERAYTIAEEVLFPRALDVDAGGVIPGSHFDLLAEQGFYGLAGQAIWGDAPFVTGWGIIDMLLVSARDVAGGPQGSIVSGLVGAEAGGGISVEELHLVAAAASNTVQLRFEDYFLPAEKVTAEVYLPTSSPGRTLPCGVTAASRGDAGRCIRMIGEGETRLG